MKTIKELNELITNRKMKAKNVNKDFTKLTATINKIYIKYTYIKFNAYPDGNNYVRELECDDDILTELIRSIEQLLDVVNDTEVI